MAQKRYKTADEIAQIFKEQYQSEEDGDWSRLLTRKQVAWLHGQFSRENPGIPCRNWAKGSRLDFGFCWQLDKFPNGAGILRVFPHDAE